MSRRGFCWRNFLKAVKPITSRKLKGPRKKFWQDRYYDRPECFHGFATG